MLAAQANRDRNSCSLIPHESENWSATMNAIDVTTTTHTCARA
jgi:hypothetical protein